MKKQKNMIILLNILCLNTTNLQPMKISKYQHRIYAGSHY